MSKQTEALKLALEAIEAFLSAGTEAEEQDASDKLCEARAAIRKAQQRPQNCGTGYCSCIECPYEQPAQQRHISYVCPQCYWSLDEQPAQQQEPVAWLHPANATCVTTDSTAYARGIPLYTSPPASKPWVGLTDAEIDTWNIVGHESLREFVRAIEAKLRELNEHGEKNA